jgi:hypothetical protein
MGGLKDVSAVDLGGAAVFEERPALPIDNLDDVALETEVNNVLTSCEATHQGEGSYLFADLETDTPLFDAQGHGFARGWRD